MPLLAKLKQLSINECLRYCQHFANEFGADGVALAHIPSSGEELKMLCGISLHDGPQKEITEALTIDSPILTSVIKRQKAIRLMDSSRHPELDEWRQAVDMPAVSSLMQAPILDAHSDEDGFWALLLFKIEGHWQYGEQISLEEALSEFMLSSDEENPARFEGEPESKLGIPPHVDDDHQASDEMLSAKLPVEQLEIENQQQKADITRLLGYIDAIKEQQVRNGNGAHEISGQDELISHLQTENQTLRESLAEMDADSGEPDLLEPELVLQAKEELRLALMELATLNTQLEQERNRPEPAQPIEQADGKVPAEKAERIAEIAQEMRQPLSSILGYTDLLLGETVGILGALQRNFLERVHNSSERMDLLVADLIDLAELDSSGIDLSRKAVDVGEVIDDAIKRLRPQLQEKQIIMRVDLPETLPSIETDQDALQQIIFHLLQNAYIATPVNREITLRAYMDRGDDFGEFLLIQLADSGGGIADADLPRVFSRVYRAQNPVIEGVGDTGVGLTIAETLSSALGGRIWVESDEGKGSTFSVLLPLTTEATLQA